MFDRINCCMQVFREAKDRVREEEAHAEKLERIWRTRQGYLHKRLDLGAVDIRAYVSCFTVVLRRWHIAVERSFYRTTSSSVC